MADMNALKQKLEEGVAGVFTSDNFLNYLRFSAVFHNYSVNNRVLIFSQMPTATHVAGFHAWKKLGRSVKKGEHGILIYAPIQRKRVVLNEETGEDEEVKYTSYTTAYVFDVSQTEGEEIPEICRELKGDVENFDEVFKAVEAISPVPIRFEKITSGAKGYFHRTEKRIAIKEGMSELATLKTALHEITHAMLHDDSVMVREKPRIETEAEGTAFLTWALRGYETGEYSFEYLASWAAHADCSELKMSLDTISATAAKFAAAIEEQLKEKAEGVA